MSWGSIEIIAPSLFTILILIVMGLCIYGFCIWEGRQHSDEPENPPKLSSIAPNSKNSVVSRKMSCRTPEAGITDPSLTQYGRLHESASFMSSYSAKITQPLLDDFAAMEAAYKPVRLNSVVVELEES